MAVKGSKFTPMRVIPYSPIARLMRYGIIVLVFIVCLPASYFLGGYIAKSEQKSAEQSNTLLHQQATASLSQELTLLRTNAEVDRQTMEDLRQLVMTQRAQITASERDLRVYKDLLSPGGKTNPLGISFGVFTVLPLKESGHFSYSLAVQKLSTKEADFTGNLEFRINGQQGGQAVQLPLYKVSAQVTTSSIPLSFKYFQTIEGDLALPANFTPQSVELIVKTGDKKNPPLVETQLDWPLSATKSK